MRTVLAHGPGWALTRGLDYDPDDTALRLVTGACPDSDGVPSDGFTRKLTNREARALHDALGRVVADHAIRALPAALTTQPASDPGPDLSAVLAARIHEETNA